jgi:Fe/S biogenesis protein NfuA
MAEVIEVSEAAKTHFRRLIAEQDEPGLGIRLSVIGGGTPTADCRLEFCAAAELEGNELALPCGGFTLWIEAEALPFLEGAVIDLKREGAGYALSIRAPRLRGMAPDPAAPLVERVRHLIAHEINPALARHRGRVELLAIERDGVAVLRFGGSCQGCGLVDQTLREGIARTLRERFPEIVEVVDATDHAAGSDPYHPRSG